MTLPMVAFVMLCATVGAAAGYILVADRRAARVLLPAMLVLVLAVGALVFQPVGIAIGHSPDAAAAPGVVSPIIVYALWAITAANVAWMIHLFLTRHHR